MITKFLIYILFLIAPLRALTASLIIEQYEPLQLTLKFSQPVQRPFFQLLYDRIHIIPYTILTNETISDQFLIQGDVSSVEAASNLLQTYSLMFNTPLSVGDGSLAIRDFTLEAENIPITMSFNPYLGFIILIGGYFFNIFTETGTLLIEFMHVYVLYMFESNMSTTVYRQIYLGTFMLPPQHIIKSQTYDKDMYIIVCLAFPPCLLLFFGTVGVIVKKWAPKQRTVFWNIVYQELVFSTFFRSANVFSFNLLYNPIQYIILSNQNLQFIESIRPIAGILVYFNLITFAFIVYIKILILNPRIGQSAAKFKQYMQSEGFKDFRILHENVHLKRWYKRNFAVLSTIKSGLIALIFFWNPIFKYLMLLLEFMHIFLIFTLIPFKDDFYRHIKVICRLLFFTEYIFIVLSYLYFSMGRVNFNYRSVTRILTGQMALFLFLLFLIFVAVFIQIYFRCSNLNYQIKVVKEANLYKLELIQKKEKDQEQNRRTKMTKYSDSKQSHKAISEVGSPEKEMELQSPERGLRKELLGDKIKTKQKVRRSKRKNKEVEIELMDLTSLGLQKNSRDRTRTEENTKKERNNNKLQLNDKKQ